MSALKELLAQLVTDELLNEETSGKLTEAYDFDVADFGEQIGTLTTERDTANGVAGDANTKIAEATERYNALEAEMTALKAMNFDKLMNGNTSDGDIVVDEPDEIPADEISIDDLFTANDTESDSEEN